MEWIASPERRLATGRKGISRRRAAGPSGTEAGHPPQVPTHPRAAGAGRNWRAVAMVRSTRGMPGGGTPVEQAPDRRSAAGTAAHEAALAPPHRAALLRHGVRRRWPIAPRQWAPGSTGQARAVACGSGPMSRFRAAPPGSHVAAMSSSAGPEGGLSMQVRRPCRRSRHEQGPQNRVAGSDSSQSERIGALVPVLSLQVEEAL